MLEKYGLVNVTNKYTQFKNSIVYEDSENPNIIYVVQASGYIRKPKKIDNRWNMSGHVIEEFPPHLPNWKEIGERLLEIKFQLKMKEITYDNAIDIRYELKVKPIQAYTIKYIFTVESYRLKFAYDIFNSDVSYKEKALKFIDNIPKNSLN